MSFFYCFMVAMFGVLCFLLGMCQEHRATRLKVCEPVKDRAAYEKCLEGGEG